MKDLEKVGTYRVWKKFEEVWTMDEHKEVEKMEPWKVEKVGQWIGSWKFEKEKKSGTRMNLKKMGIRM